MLNFRGVEKMQKEGGEQKSHPMLWGALDVVEPTPHQISEFHPWVGWAFLGDDKILPSLYRDYFISNDIRIPIKQPGFNGMSQGF